MTDARPKDFLRTIVDEDLAAGRHQQVATRFPPEPNGYLHIGHAKAICVDFGIAREYGGTCNLRFDDTNPTKEDVEYVEAIERDVRWLGFAPDRILFASDYFEDLYQLAEGLIERGLAYVDDHDEEQIRAHRGSLTEPGRPSPWRGRTVEENLARFRAMRAGELPDGACVLRAKIDLAAANMKMRDPLLYRIRHAHHHRTGDAWCIYPMYDYAHPLSDALEGITHSLCTLEFENNRELYDWVIAATGVTARADLVGGRPVAGPPHQYEFARLVLEYTMMSKRKLLRLVEDGVVTGWDDPRMPTLAGMRRRGFTPEAIRELCDLVGVAKNNSTVDVGKLEYAVRSDLNGRAPRLLGVVRPLAVTLTNVEAASLVEAPLFPEDIDPTGARGTRQIPFDKHLYIEQEDFAEVAPDGWKRLAPGRVVRLRHAGLIRCDEVVKDAAGAVVELRCSVVDDGKVAGVLHWVSATRGVTCEVRLYDRLFTTVKPDAAEDITEVVNPASLEVVTGAVVEPAVVAAAGTPIQLERVGYFVADCVDSRPDALVLNRVITLRDTIRAHLAATLAPATLEATAEVKTKASRAATRPPKKSGAEQRAIARERDAELAARYAGAVETLGADTADLIHGDRDSSDFFEACRAAAPFRAELVARWMVNELPRVAGDADLAETALTPAALTALIGLVEDRAITAAVAKDLLPELVADGGDPVALVDARGLRQVSGDAAAAALTPIIAEVLSKHAGKLAEYRGGKTGLLGFFVGQVMKASGGKASPAAVNAAVAAALAADAQA
ncbi:MAG: glutamine--tRNA ligase/YqeY domain fusion protein [Kofleriaceae bacterium]